MIKIKGKAKRDTSEKGGDRRTGRKKASGPPPAGGVSRETATAAKVSAALAKAGIIEKMARPKLGPEFDDIPFGKPIEPAPPVTEGSEVTFLVKAPKALLVRLELTRAKLGLRSRNEAVVRLLEEGAEK